MDRNDIIYKEILDNLYDGVYFVDEKRVITYWNKGAERITGYTSAEVVGKRCADNILVHVDHEGNVLCQGVCPVGETLADGTHRSTEVYLHHRAGHRVPITVRVAPIRDAQDRVVGAVEVFSDNTPEAAALQRLAEAERMAYVDPLTGLANRRYAEIILRARHEEMERYGWIFGVLFADIDRFKKINDGYGHAAGDEVLKMVARTLANSVRSFDLVSRWGGEEFLAIIANVDREELAATANRFRALVEQSNLSSVQDLRVTISVGATLARPEDGIDGLLARVDSLMYQSKSGGRNRATIG